MPDPSNPTNQTPDIGQPGIPQPDIQAPLRVYLVVVDESPEMRVALRYAAGRARHTNGRVALLYVIEPTGGQHWRALEALMRDEQREEAEALMSRLAEQVAAMTHSPPVVHLREGNRRDELLALLAEDPMITALVLGAGTGDAGPGPLVGALTGKMSARVRVPIIIIPGGLTEAEIDALT